VQIIYKKSGLQLISKGKSLSNAAVGDTVKIVRKDAARTLEGIAVSDGVVEINSGVSN
jgi:flagella basal body P-ring formation protein FlgA